MNCVPSLPSPLAHAYLITGGSQEARRTYAERWRPLICVQESGHPVAAAVPVRRWAKGSIRM